MMTRRTKTGERGATLLETALVVPMLLMIVLGLADVGFLVIDKMAVANAAREGARVGAAAGKYVSGSINADTLILRSVEQAVCHVENGQVTRVSIYRATANGSLPSNSSFINEYVPPASGILNCSAAGTTSLTCDNGCPWTPPSRDNSPPTLDDLGVLVEFEHEPVVGLFPFNGTMTLTDHAVMRIEPNTRG